MDYLDRLATANGYRVGEFQNVLVGNGQLHALALREALDGHALPTFSGPAMKDVDIPVESYGLRQQDFIRYWPRWCPLCVGVAAWLRPVWRLKVATVCSTHQVRLLQRCPGCGVRPGTWAILRGTCECGHRFVQGTTSATKASVHLARVLDFSLCNQARLEVEGASVTLNTAQLVRLILYVGRVIDEPGLSRPGQIRDMEDLAVAQKQFEGAAALLTDWPNVFWRCLERRLDAAPLDASVRRVFGPLYHVIYQNLRDPEYQFLRDAFELFLLDHWRGELCGRHRLFQEETITKYSNRGLACVARLAGMGSQTLRRMVSQQWLSANRFTGPSKRELITIDRAQLAQFIPDPADYLDLRSTARFLGIKRTRVRQLVAGGILVADPRPEWSKSNHWLFRRDVLKAFIRQIRGGSQSQGVSGEGVALGHALRYWLVRPSELCVLMRAMTRGDLRYWMSARDTLRETTFEKAELRVWLDQLRLTETNWVSVQVAAGKLGLKEQVVYQLAAKNLLVVDLVPKPNHTLRRVSLSSIERFRAEYVSLAEFAKQKGTSASALLSRLKVTPVTGPKVDGGRQYFFRRGDLLIRPTIRLNWHGISATMLSWKKTMPESSVQPSNTRDGGRSSEPTNEAGRGRRLRRRLG